MISTFGSIAKKNGATRDSHAFHTFLISGPTLGLTVAAKGKGSKKSMAEAALWPKRLEAG